MKTEVPPPVVPLTVEQALQEGIAHHQAGRLHEAEKFYRAILQTQPNHPAANHNLGVLAMNVGQPVVAIAHFKAAVEVDQNFGQYWVSYIDALIQTGQIDVARQIMELCRLKGFKGEGFDRLAARLADSALRSEPSAQAISAIMEAYTCGQHAEAIGLTQHMLNHFPQFGFGWKMMGALLLLLGKNTEALEYMQKAVTLLPNDPDVHNNLGHTLHQLRRLDEAEASIRRALQIDPDYAEAHNNLGNTLLSQRRLAEAEASCRRALLNKPDFASAYNNLGVILHERGQLGEAEATFRQALQSSPQYAEAHYNLAGILHNVGRLDEAETSFRCVLEINPNFAEAHNHLGTVLRELEQLEQAEVCIRHALQINPHYAEAHNNFGNVLLSQGRLDEAEASCWHALMIKPDFADAHISFGAILLKMGKLGEAEESIERALCIDPNIAEAHNILGVIWYELGLPIQSEASCRRALQIKPDCANAHLNLGFALLQTERFVEGWPEYEYRWKVKDSKPLPSFAHQYWNGNADLAGKSILLFAEQGYGDTLQFIRYAPILTELGATVYLEVPHSLKSLAARCAGIAAVFVTGDELPAFEYCCPLLSLPLACKTELLTIPSDVPYLDASPELIASWREKLGNTTSLRVGLAWAGNPREHRPLAQVIDKQRSVHFNQLQPLLGIPGTEFYSLQLGNDAVAQLNANPQVIDFTGDIHDFQDTAALITNLDLVISVDTSVSHLAGALGKPVWLLNRFNTDWRWLLGRENSPWYPSMRIFRQASSGEWDSVIQNVKRALEAKIQSKAI